MFRRRKKQDPTDELYLKPCPFCGGDAELAFGSGVKIRCRECGVATPIYRGCDVSGSHILKDAIQTWNTRTCEKEDDNA